MHKKAMECAKKTLEEFCLIGEPTAEQACMFKDIMGGLKDFICAEKDYEIIDAMKEADEEEKLMSKMGMNERMGYNRSRDSMGRYTSKRRGYRPYLGMDEDEYMGEYLDNPAEFERNMRMGYSDNGNQNMNGRSGWNNGNSRYGESYDTYRGHRKHYTETHNAEDHEKMKKAIDDTVDDFKMIVTDVWKDMEPAEKQRRKQELMQMIQNLPA